MTLIFTYKEPVSFSPEDGKPLPRKVHFAADRMATSGYSRYKMITPKFKTYGDFVFGLGGDARIGQLLAYSINDIDATYRSHEVRKDDLDFVIENVIQCFQEALNSAGFSVHTPEGYLNFEGVLITPTARVFSIGPDLSVCEFEEPLWVIGSGECAAKAVWDVLNDLSWDIFEGLETVEDRVQATFRYVARNDSTVSQEIDYMVLEQKWND